MTTPLNIQHAPLSFPVPIKDKKTVCFHLKKLFPQFVFDIAKLEGSPYTLPQVQTLLEGITVGGKRLEDQQLVLNQKNSLQRLIELVLNNQFNLDKQTFCDLHRLVAFEEALVWGEFRTDKVSIAGTHYRPPPANQLDDIFTDVVTYVNQIQHPLEQALLFFLLGSLAQFFFDGNKRTSRLMMNGLLLSQGIDAISIPAKEKQSFNTQMIRFYNTQKADNMLRFLCRIAGYRLKKQGSVWGLK